MTESNPTLHRNTKHSRSHHWVRLPALILLAVAFFIGCSKSDQTATGKNSDIGDTKIVAVEDSQSKNQLSNAQYVDDAMCADCHQEIYDSYQKVAMAKSFYDFDPHQTIESFDENQFFHSPSGNHYEMKVVGNALNMKRFRLRADGSKYAVHQQSAQCVVGSGKHVRTYLSRNESGEMFQLPVVWYSQDQKWGMAPGYDSADHPDFSRPITRQCMFCHNAYPEFEPGSDLFGQPHLFPAKMPQGIGCQRCHGPGSQHVRLAGEVDEQTEQGRAQIQDSIINSARLAPERQDDVCNQCHFQPMSQRSSFVRKFSKGDYGYLPGQPLPDYMVHFEPDRDNEKADHFEINHHPYRLFQSQCYLKTPGGIRCTDCHDPHKKIETPQQPEFYRQKCYSCHEKNDCGDVERGRAADANCISCHMQARRTTDVVNVTMTDHKISRRQKLDNPTAELKETSVPIDMPIRRYEFASQDKAARELSDDELRIYSLFARALDDDELAVAPLKKTVSKHSGNVFVPAMQLVQHHLQSRDYKAAQSTLKQIESADEFEFNNLTLFHIHRGVSQIGLKQFESAVTSLQHATTIDPKNASGWYNLATAKQRMRDLNGAITCLDKAIELRPTYALAFKKRGTLAARTENNEQAILDLTQAISLNPRDLSVYQRLATVHRQNQNYSSAIQTLDDAISIDSKDEQTNLELAWTLLDPGDHDAENLQRAALTANRIFTRNKNAKSLLTQAMALLQNQKADAALQLLGERLAELEKQNRKPEAGLLFAICQLRIEQKDSAEQNYKAASQAMRSQTKDRLARLIQQLAEREFSHLSE